MSRSSLSEEPRKLKGPRPAPLKVIKTGSSTMKKALPIQRTSPVVVYLASPKIIHVRPDQFMGLVQRLTGRKAPTESSVLSLPSSSSFVMENNKFMTMNHDYGAANYADQTVCVSSPPSSNNLAALPSLYTDIYADWDEFWHSHIC